MLRDAVVEQMKVVYGAETDVTRDDVSITAGCNLAFAAAAMTVAGEGDEVILPVPWLAFTSSPSETALTEQQVLQSRVRHNVSSATGHSILLCRMTLSMLGIKPVWLKTSPENGFQPSVTECAKLITPATRAIVLVTPNNPVSHFIPVHLRGS